MRHADQQSRQSAEQGFSLLEMAVVLVIVGLLLGGVLGNLGTMQQQQRENETRAQMNEIREALLTFAAVNRRLPCPADPGLADTVTGAGLERTPTAAGCTGGPSGVVPWATLGLPQTDAWGRRFSYRVTPALSRSGVAITLTSVGDNTIRNGSTVTIAAAVPAVVVSHGMNAAGSRNRAGALAAAGTNAFEVENGNGNNVFVADTPVAGYDDLVLWVPPSILIGRMLQAGTLP